MSNSIKPLEDPVRLRRRPNRRGQALVEFALVAFALYLLLAAILTFGRALYVAQGVQQAADVAARELSHSLLPANIELEEVLSGNANANPDLADVRAKIYDPHYLVFFADDGTDAFGGHGSLSALMANLPVVNQQLVPLMITDQVGGRRIIRYPGALVEDTDPTDDPADPLPSGYLVTIPVVNSRSATGVETIQFVPVVEEIDTEWNLNNSGANPDPFRLTPSLGTSATQTGLVALRINYPFQSTTLSSFRTNPDATSGEHADPRFRKNLSLPNAADDGAVTLAADSEEVPAGPLVTPDAEVGTYSGAYGLGSHAALGPLVNGQFVRPFRRVISAQAVYRREVFQ